MTEMPKNRVVITGMGAFSLLGGGVDKLWSGIQEAKTCFRELEPGEDFLADVFPTKSRLRGVMNENEIEKTSHFDFRKVKKLYKFEQCLVAACCEAMTESRLKLGRTDRQRVGIIIGSDYYHLISLESYLMQERSEQHTPAAIATFIALNLKINGPAFAISSGEGSGLTAIGMAFDYIRDRRCDVVLVGGGSQLNSCLIKGYEDLGFVSTPPQECCLPMDRHANGTILAEGAGFLILEAQVHARERSAKIYGEILGYGTANEARELEVVKAVESAAEKAMTLSLADAKIDQDAIDFLCASANGHPLLDQAEIEAVKRLFKGRANDLPVFSIKGIVGETLNAGGLLNVITCIHAMEAGMLPQTVDTQKAEQRLSSAALSEKVDLQVALTNSVSLDGSCTSLVVGRD